MARNLGGFSFAEMEIRSLKDISFDALYTAWDEAFKGYAASWSREELQKDLRRRGYTPELSFGTFDNEKLVSFTLNGIGTFNGIKTAYDTGTATVTDYRGKGLATKIFEAAVPYLKDAGCKQYLLEVLQDNTSAISVYKKLGFTITRGFNYFRQEADKVQMKHTALLQHEAIQPITIALKTDMTALGDHEPSWQNSFESIERAPYDFVIAGAYNADKLIGYGILAPATGDITQLAVHKDHRRQGIGSAILHSILQSNRSGKIKVINTEETDNAITSFLEANGIPKCGSQYEMILPIL
ncbi:MAG: GNAT family N-acetyltransferase [Bacteroidetes bacterium]|nr:GNAT family N-acetyltransferase [Bacteroidota bacterium]